jgi:hypothetical protein
MSMPHGLGVPRTLQGVRLLARVLGVPKSSVSRWLQNMVENADALLKMPREVVEVYLLLKKRRLRFYTTPPSGTPWPWILANIFSVNTLETLLNTYRDMGIKTCSVHVILDAGVDRYWKKPCTKLSVDYDDEYWSLFWSAVDSVKKLHKEFGFSFEVVVPDYVDDYSSVWGRKHCLWIDNYTNVERTLENVFHVINQDWGVPWLLPAQGFENTPQSVLKSIEVYESHGLHKRYRIGLANLCTSKKSSMVVETIRLAREFCSNCRYHVFGPSLTAIKKAIALGYLQPEDSWDSVAWTFPRGGGWSAKTVEERIAYFLFYLKHIISALRE